MSLLLQRLIVLMCSYVYLNLHLLKPQPVPHSHCPSRTNLLNKKSNLIVLIIKEDRLPLIIQTSQVFLHLRHN